MAGALYARSVPLLVAAVAACAVAATLAGAPASATPASGAVAPATAATVTVIFAIVGNLVISSLAAREVITMPAYMQVGGISLLVSILLFYVVSLVTSNRHPDATLAFLYLNTGAAELVDPLLARLG